MTGRPSRLRNFAVRGVIWRNYLDWAILNTPFYLHTVLMFFCTLFFFFFAAPARRAVLRNLRFIFPGSSPLLNQARAFRTLWNFAWTIAEAARYKLHKTEYEYELEGTEFLAQLAAGEGAIVLTAHMGNYDLGAALFAQKFGRTIRMVRAPEEDEKTAAHLDSSLRQIADGAVTVDYNTRGALLSFDLLSALRAGEIVSIQGDRPTGAGGDIACQFFGEEVRFPAGPFILGLAAEVPICPLFIVRRGYRRYCIVARAAIMAKRTARARELDLADAANRWSVVLADVVRHSWDQWFAFQTLFTSDARK